MRKNRLQGEFEAVNPSGENAALEAGYATHIRRIGEEKFDAHKHEKHPARRWVMERAGAWFNGCRAIGPRD